HVAQAVGQRPGRGGRIDGGRSLVDRPDHPARPVDADEPQVLQALRGAYPGPQLRPVLARFLVNRDTLAEQRLADVGARLVPDVLAARRGERGQLQHAVLVYQQHLLDGTVRPGLYPHLDALDHRDLQAAQVDQFEVVGCLAHVEGPGGWRVVDRRLVV